MWVVPWVVMAKVERIGPFSIDDGKIGQGLEDVWMLDRVLFPGPSKLDPLVGLGRQVAWLATSSHLFCRAQRNGTVRACHVHGRIGWLGFWKFNVPVQLGGHFQPRPNMHAKRGGVVDGLIQIEIRVQTQKLGYILPTVCSKGVLGARQGFFPDIAKADGAIDPGRVRAVVDGRLRFEGAYLGQDGNDEHADCWREVETVDATENGGCEFSIGVVQIAAVNGGEDVPAKHVARDGEEDGDHGPSSMQQAYNGQRRPLADGFRGPGRARAIAQHNERRPWPEEVVVEDEETGDSAQAVETLDLGRRRSRATRLSVFGFVEFAVVFAVLGQDGAILPVVVRLEWWRGAIAQRGHGRRLVEIDWMRLLAVAGGGEGIEDVARGSHKRKLEVSLIRVRC